MLVHDDRRHVDRDRVIRSDDGSGGAGQPDGHRCRGEGRRRSLSVGGGDPELVVSPVGQTADSAAPSGAVRRARVTKTVRNRIPRDRRSVV